MDDLTTLTVTQRRLLLEVLRRLEKRMWREADFCLVCECHGKHDSGCELAAELAELEKAEPVLLVSARGGPQQTYRGAAALAKFTETFGWPSSAPHAKVTEVAGRFLPYERECSEDSILPDGGSSCDAVHFGDMCPEGATMPRRGSGRWRVTVEFWPEPKQEE
jgi:hypothetical protein